MKRLLSFLLALLLLGSVTVFAETAPTLSLSDPVLDIEGMGDPVHLDLSGLTVRLALLSDEKDPGLAVNVLGKGKLLLSAAARLAGDRILLGLDGLSRSYYLQLPQNFDPSQLDLSALQTDRIIEILRTEGELVTEGDETRFRLPHTALNAVLRELTPLLGQLPLTGTQREELLDLLGQLEETDSGFDLEGRLTREPGGGSGELRLTLVQDGTAAPFPLFAMSGAFHTDETGADCRLSASASEDGDAAMPLFAFTGTLERSDTEQRFSLTFGESPEKLEQQPVFGLTGSLRPAETGADFDADLHVGQRRYIGEQWEYQLYHAMSLTGQVRQPEEGLSTLLCDIRTDPDIEDDDSFVRLTGSLRHGETETLAHLDLLTTYRNGSPETVMRFDYSRGSSPLGEDCRAELLVDTEGYGYLRPAFRYERSRLRSAGGEDLRGLLFADTGEGAARIDFDLRRLRTGPENRELRFSTELLLDDDGYGGLRPMLRLELGAGKTFTLRADLPEDAMRFSLDCDPSDGRIDAAFESEDGSGRASALLSTGTEEISVCRVSPIGAIDAENMSPEQTEAFNGELQTATAALVGFLLPPLIRAGLLN